MSEAWIEAQFTVGRELGLHARPSGQIVSLAQGYTAEIEIARIAAGGGDAEGEWVSGRSVLSILSLAASQGTRLAVRARGGDASEALAAVGEVIAAGDD